MGVGDWRALEETCHTRLQLAAVDHIGFDHEVVGVICSDRQEPRAKGWWNRVGGN